jgi:polyisoprenoid-binding protein YceI
VKVNGDMTIKDITQKMKIEGKIIVSGGKITITADFRIKLTDYNITGQPVEAGKVSKEPKVTVSAEF